MDHTKSKLESIKELALRRGIIVPTAKIYGSLAGAYDFGPIGTLLKRNIESLWRDIFIEEHTWEIDGNVILPREVFEASGHIDNFTDYMVQCKNCKSILRADELIETQTKKQVGENAVERMEEIFRKGEIQCSVCGSTIGTAVDIKPFNIMFNLDVGPTGKGEGFLRPETAQNMFLNFRNTRMGVKENLPFALAQIGKSFRNEISPRQFLFRLREFNQMEIEIFGTSEIFQQHPRLEGDRTITFLPKDQDTSVEISLKEAVTQNIFPNEYFAYLIDKTAEFYRSLGIPKADLRFKEIPDQDRPFYSEINVDVEIKYGIGWKEVEGTAYRTNFDLQRHSEFSGENLQVLHEGEQVLPHVVEASFGIDRSLMALLEKSFHKKKEDRKWSWFDFPRKLTPLTAAVFPLFDRESLVTKAREVFKEIRSQGLKSIYKEKGSIGKRYRFADEIGIPYCITIDPTTIDENTATIREINSKEQIRPSCKKIPPLLSDLLKGKVAFKQYQKTGQQ